MNLKTILIIIIFALVGVAVCYFIGGLGENLFTPITAQINSWIGGFNVGEAVANPASVLVTVGGIAAVATPLLSKLSTAKQQVQDVTTQAKTQIGGLSSQLDSTTNKLSSTETSLASITEKLKGLETSNITLQNQAAEYKKQFDNLNLRYTELQRTIGADVIANLPGGTTITKPDGSKIAVIERKVVV